MPTRRPHLDTARPRDPHPAAPVIDRRATPRTRAPANTSTASPQPAQSPHSGNRAGAHKSLPDLQSRPDCGRHYRAPTHRRPRGARSLALGPAPEHVRKERPSPGIHRRPSIPANPELSATAHLRQLQPHTLARHRSWRNPELPAGAPDRQLPATSNQATCRSSTRSSNTIEQFARRVSDHRRSGPCSSSQPAKGSGQRPAAPVLTCAHCAGRT